MKHATYTYNYLYFPNNRKSKPTYHSVVAASIADLSDILFHCYGTNYQSHIILASVIDNRTGVVTKL